MFRQGPPASGEYANRAKAHSSIITSAYITYTPRFVRFRLNEWMIMRNSQKQPLEVPQKKVYLTNKIKFQHQQRINGKTREATDKRDSQR